VSAVRSKAWLRALRPPGRSRVVCRRPRAVLVACIAMLALTVAACSSGKSSGASANTSGVSANTGPIQIGTVLPLSGALASTGGIWLAGMTAEVDEVNAAGGVHGRKINLVKVDDGYQIPNTIVGIKELAGADKVDAIIGPFGTAAGIAAVPVAAQVQVPLVGPLAYTTALFKPVQKYIFALWPGTDQVYRALATYAISHLHAKRLALISDDTPPGDLATSGVTGAASSGGAQVVANVRLSASEADFTGVVQQIAASKPDALLIDTDTPNTAQIMVDMQRSHLVLPTIAGLSGADAQFPPAAGSAGSGVYGATYIGLTTSAPGWDAYSAAMTAYTKVSPANAYAAAGYVAMQVIARSLATVKGTLTPDSLRNAIETTPITSLAGVLQFSPTNHLGNPVLYLTQIVKGQVTFTGTKLPLS
jgi:branched-chain amino acid transport system substrate-binding protein